MGCRTALIAALLLHASLAAAADPAPQAAPAPSPATAQSAQPSKPAHGLAMHGDLRYPADFKHFAYVNPDAPKGGTQRQAGLGTFDSLNPFIVKGNPAAGLALIYDTLMTPSADEPFSEYGLLAESIEIPQDRSWVIFRLRPEARWHDGKPITADDVIWTFEALRSKGQPFYRSYYAGVEKVEKLDDRGVRFQFKPGVNRELPLILGQLPVLPKHYWESRDFTATTLETPLGSGPYRLESFEPGRNVRYQRVPDYWGKDLPVNRGRHNVDRYWIDYYRDETVALEAFKAGGYDFRLENSAKVWATGYDFPAIKNGLVQKKDLPHSRPVGMQAFAFNTRRDKFQDPRVRQALGNTFDFEWSNQNLFYGQYTRTRSYFDNSELAATGVPSGEELKILEPYRGKVPDDVFTKEYRPPVTDGSGSMRENFKEAVRLFEEAGWTIDPKTRKLTKTSTGETMKFEVLLVSPLFERIALPWKKNLERLGIDVSVRTVDAAQYRQMIDDFDFDVLVYNWGQSESPGNEQRNFWGSAAANEKGSQNAVGIRDPVVDQLVEVVIAAQDRQALVNSVRALDRVLQWGQWVIPQWHIPYDRVAYWDKFGQPAVLPSQGFQLDTWWIDPEKEKALEQRRSSSK